MNTVTAMFNKLMMAMTSEVETTLAIKTVTMLLVSDSTRIATANPPLPLSAVLLGYEHVCELNML